MAGKNGLWQRMPSPGKFAFVTSLVNICFLLVCLGLTAWSISGYTFFIDFFEQRSSSSIFPTSTFGSASGGFTIFTTVFGSQSSSSTTARSYSTFTSTFTTTRTSYTTDPARYTSTIYYTLSRAGAPYSTATQYRGESSGYTTLTSTVERLVRTRVQKRDEYTAKTTAAMPVASHVEPTRWSVPTAAPTAAPLFTTDPCPSPSSSPSPAYQQIDDQQRRIALPGTKTQLYRRQSSLDFSIQDFIDAAKVLRALVSVILAAVVIQLLLCVAYLILLNKAHKLNRTDHQLLCKGAKYFCILFTLTSLLIFAFAIASVAYGNSQFSQTGNFIALYMVFWMVSCILGFILAINAYKLSRHAAHQQKVSRDSTIEPLETDQREDGPFIFAYNREEQASEAQHTTPQAAQAAPAAQPAQPAQRTQQPAHSTADATPSQASHSTQSPAQSQQHPPESSQPGPARQVALQDYSPHTHTHEQRPSKAAEPESRRSADVPAPPPYSDEQVR